MYSKKGTFECTGGYSSLVKLSVEVGLMHGCTFPRTVPLFSSCCCELLNNLLPQLPWVFFSYVFICPAATLPLEEPFLDGALQCNVTLCCTVVFFLSSHHLVRNNDTWVVNLTIFFSHSKNII